MSLYLYLNEHWHVNAWVNGGKVPINPASFYKSTSREGVLTPDENLIHNSPVDIKSLEPFIFVDLESGGGLVDFSIHTTSFNGFAVPDIEHADYYEDDGLILSFSHRLTRSVARKMKKKACVKIIDVSVLKSHLDEQLGVVSIADYCEYTDSHQRNHFLKSEFDRWQAEFRLFWPLANRVEVEIPAGIAELICEW